MLNFLNHNTNYTYSKYTHRLKQLLRTNGGAKNGQVKYTLVTPVFSHSLFETKKQKESLLKNQSNLLISFDSNTLLCRVDKHSFFNLRAYYRNLLTALKYFWGACRNNKRILFVNDHFIRKTLDDFSINQLMLHQYNRTIIPRYLHTVEPSFSSLGHLEAISSGPNTKFAKHSTDKNKKDGLKVKLLVDQLTYVLEFARLTSFLTTNIASQLQVDNGGHTKTSSDNHFVSNNNYQNDSCWPTLTIQHSKNHLDNNSFLEATKTNAWGLIANSRYCANALIPKSSRTLTNTKQNFRKALDLHMKWITTPQHKSCPSLNYGSVLRASADGHTHNTASSNFLNSNRFKLDVTQLFETDFYNSVAKPSIAGEIMLPYDTVPRNIDMYTDYSMVGTKGILTDQSARKPLNTTNQSMWKSIRRRFEPKPIGRLKVAKTEIQSANFENQNAQLAQQPALGGLVLPCLQGKTRRCIKTLLLKRAHKILQFQKRTFKSLKRDQKQRSHSSNRTYKLFLLKKQNKSAASFRTLIQSSRQKPLDTPAMLAQQDLLTLALKKTAFAWTQSLESSLANSLKPSALRKGFTPALSHNVTTKLKKSGIPLNSSRQNLTNRPIGKLFNLIQSKNKEAAVSRIAVNPWIQYSDIMLFINPERNLEAVNSAKSQGIVTIGITTGSVKPLPGRTPLITRQSFGLRDTVDVAILGNVDSPFFITNLVETFMLFVKNVKKSGD